jgi:hypothetical protein
MALNFPNSPTNGQVYLDVSTGNRWAWDAANTCWKSTSVFTQAITVAASAPGEPVVGQLWWNQDYGRLLVYYNDGTSSQWVDASPSDYTSTQAFNQSNNSYAMANASFNMANGSYATANAASANAATANVNVGRAYSTANAGFAKANNALANTTGTFAGDLTVAGNFTSTGTLASSSRGITKASLPTGSILQVAQVVKTDAFTTSSTSPVDITGMSVTITPTSSTSKILVIVDLKWSSYAHSDIYLLRNGTKIYYGDLYGNQTQALLHSYASGGSDDYGLAYGHATYLDSPATTSAVTYKLQGAVPWSASYVIAVGYMRPNENNAYNARVASSMTVFEVAQ